MTKLFEDADRYAYPFDHESVVMDVGAFHGEFARAMWDRYKCKVYAFEPIARFNDIARKRVMGCAGVQLSLYGVAGSTREEFWKIKGDMTGAFNQENDEQERVILINVVKLLETLPLPPMIDLLKLNVEGMEYEILQTLIESGAVKRFRHIQVQPHSIVPNAEKHWQAVHLGLLKTHDLAYHKDFVWSGYTLRK